MANIRPGLYISFIENAVKQITGGARGIVAIPLKTYNTTTATAQKFYTVTTEKEAVDLFGSANIESITLALRGGAKEVLVWTLPAIDGTTVTTASAYAEAREQFETRAFHVFVFDGEVTDTDEDAFKTWVVAKREEGKHFFVVFGGDATSDNDVSASNTRSGALDDDYIINLISGVEMDGISYSSGAYAPFIAGLIAATPINKSITYNELPVDDVTKRLRKTEIESALTAGSLVLVHDGEVVRIEQGLTTSGKKVRAMSSRQAIATDIKATANRSFIGKLDNTVDARKSLIASITAYLERLQADNVLTNIVVKEDELNPSVGDTVNLTVSYVEIDSMEKINIGVIL